MTYSLLIWVAFFLTLPSAVFGWGEGTHLYQGNVILANLSLLSPVLQNLLHQYSIDFLYGLICPDFYVGKGMKKKYHHCHNWGMGESLLREAVTDRQKAFAYGYLGHLAGDIIAHNYFIPIFLHQHSGLINKYRHVYWEMIADTMIPNSTWRHLKLVTYHNHDENDHLMNQVLRTHPDVFRMKRFVYKRGMELQHVKAWRAQLLKSRKKYHPRILEAIHRFQYYSLYCVIDFLKQDFNSVVMKYDPIGRENILRFRFKDLNIPKPLRELPAAYGEKLKSV